MTKKETITVPNIGDYSNVPVIEVLVNVGDQIGVEDPLITLESDKAAMEVPSPVSGKLIELLVDIGGIVSEGSAVAVVEVSELSSDTPSASSPAEQPDSAVAPSAPPAAKKSTQALKPASAPAVLKPNVLSSTGHASPSVRALARALGADLNEVTPSGPKGRILEADLKAHVKSKLASRQGGNLVPSEGIAPAPSIDFEKFGPISEIKRTRIQTIAAGNLHRNWLTIPHVTNFDHADVSELEELRKSINSAARGEQPKLTMVAFLIKASAIALQNYPRFNTSLDGENLIQKEYVHIGFAADTPAGLVVPVIRDADLKGVLEIAGEVIELAGKAREGKLSGSDMQGGCFTVSSLGGVGGDGFTPIINAPEVAILGAGRSSIEPVWDGEEFKPREILPVSLSWDHRVVDGVAAARFLGRIASLLGDFRRAVL